MSKEERPSGMFKCSRRGEDQEKNCLNSETDLRNRWLQLLFSLCVIQSNFSSHLLTKMCAYCLMPISVFNLLSQGKHGTNIHVKTHVCTTVISTQAYKSNK